MTINQDLQFDNMTQRPKQMKKIYGNLNEISKFERTNKTAKRIVSGDPRLRGLENIYLNSRPRNYMRAS